MAIDPNIAMGFRMPDFVGQAVALRRVGLEQQLGQQQLQRGDQDLQEGQMRLNQTGQAWQDNQADRAAVQKNMVQNPDGSTTLNRAGYLSDLGKTAPTLAMQRTQEFAQQDFQRQQQQTMLTEERLKAAKAHTDAVGGLLQGIVSQPTPELKQQAYTRALQQAQQQGIVKPGELPDVYDENLVQQQLAQTLSQKDQIDQHLQALKAAEDARHNQQTEATATQAQNETADYHGKEIAVRRQEAGISGARLALDRSKQDLDNNQAVETQAQQIANGDVKPLSQARSNPFNRAVMARVYEINPKYSDSLYTATQDLRSSKPNSMGANVGRLGTAILHADNALQNSGKLGFSEGLLTGVGTQGTAAYKKDADFLTGEIGQYVIGKSLTVDEGNKLSSDLFSSRQGVRDAAIHEVIKLSKGKLQSQMQSFKNATQNEFPTDRVFNDPEIKASLEKHGVLGEPAAAAAPAAAPNTHVFSVSAWQQANPKGDAAAAKVQAAAQGYQVVQ